MIRREELKEGTHFLILNDEESSPAKEKDKITVTKQAKNSYNNPWSVNVKKRDQVVIDEEDEYEE